MFSTRFVGLYQPPPPAWSHHHFRREGHAVALRVARHLSLAAGLICG